MTTSTKLTLALMLAVNLVHAQNTVESNPVIQQLAVNVPKTEQEPNVIANTVQNSNDDDPMRAKTFSKSFPADNSDKIMLSNQYGSIQVKIWDKQEVKVDVDIKAYGNNDTEAQKLLDGVNIEAGKSGDQITFKTKMEQNGSWGRGSNSGKKWRREVRISYVVYMPAANALTMSQNYGNIDMGDLSGALYVKVQYGSFTAGNLSNTNNYISVQYGSANIQSVNKAIVKHQYGPGLTIASAGTLDVDAQYTAVTLNTIKGNAVIKKQYGGELNVGSVENIDLDAQYTNVKLGTVKGNARVHQQYNSLNIVTVGKLEVDCQYANTTVGTLRGDGKFNMQYNRLNIDEVGTGCKNLNVDGAYVNISIGFDSGYSADIDVRTSYASFKYDGDIMAKQIGNDDSNSKSYTGKIGKGGGATVKVKSDYGGVNLQTK